MNIKKSSLAAYVILSLVVIAGGFKLWDYLSTPSPTPPVAARSAIAERRVTVTAPAQDWSTDIRLPLGECVMWGPATSNDVFEVQISSNGSVWEAYASGLPNMKIFRFKSKTGRPSQVDLIFRSYGHCQI